VREEDVIKRILLLAVVLGTFVSTAFGAGLGNTIESISGEYGIKIQTDEIHAFGNPPRAGRLEANAAGLFGSFPDTNPNTQQFFNGVRKLMPADAKLTASYKRYDHYLKEIYTFKSKTLAKFPNIKEAMAYQKDLGNHPVGTFFMTINYDIKHKDCVANFTIALGLPEVDIEDMKKVSKNPFK
jgi:hypothetical protein